MWGRISLWFWFAFPSREGGERGWDDWMASLTQWVWVWANSGRRWRTGKPGVLQSTGSQRVRHNWVTELNWRFVHGLIKKKKFIKPWLCARHWRGKWKIALQCLPSKQPHVRSEVILAIIYNVSNYKAVFVMNSQASDLHSKILSLEEKVILVRWSS